MRIQSCMVTEKVNSLSTACALDTSQKTHRFCLTLGENIRQTEMEAHCIKYLDEPLQGCHDRQKI